MRILIVEDNYEFAVMLSAFLQEAGFRTCEVLSGKEGVKAALSFLPDLIILDYQLGDMTGYDVAIALKYMRKTSSTSFIVLSSLGADPMLVSGFKKMPNCRAVLLKTLPLYEILGVVKEALPSS